MTYYNMRIENKRFRNISAVAAACIIIRNAQRIKDLYNVDPLQIANDIRFHADAIRLAWYDENERIFLSLNVVKSAR